MTSLILAVLTADVGSSFSIFYEPKAERADLEEGWKMREIFTESEDYNLPDKNVLSITFDYYNQDGTYISQFSGTLKEDSADTKLGQIDVFRCYDENGLINIYVLSDVPIYASVDSAYMFANLTMCGRFKFANFNTSEVEDMNHLFYGTAVDSSLKSKFDSEKYALDLVDFDIRICKNLQDMFTGYGLGFSTLKIFVGENFRPDKAEETNPNQKLNSLSQANLQSHKGHVAGGYSISNSYSTWNGFLDYNGLSVIGFYSADFNAWMGQSKVFSVLGTQFPLETETVNFLIFDRFQSDVDTPGTYIDHVSGYAVARNYNCMLVGGEGVAETDWTEIGKWAFPFVTYAGYEDYLLDTHKIYLGWNMVSIRTGVNYIYFLSDTQIYGIDGSFSGSYYISGREYADSYYKQAGMFANLPRLQGLKFNNFSTELMTDMQYMFYNSANWGKVEDGSPLILNYCAMGSGGATILQYEAYYLELNLSAFDFSNVSLVEGGFDYMFNGASHSTPCGVGYLYLDDFSISDIFRPEDYGYGYTWDNSVLYDNLQYLGYTPCDVFYEYQPKPWE